MKKNYLLLFACLCVWQIQAQVLNQNAAWPNAAWTVTGTYSVAPGAFEGNPTTSANFAWDDDDAGNPSDDQIAAESPVINLTAAHAAGEQKVRVSAQHTYRYLGPDDVLRFEYWNAATSTWVPWGANLPGNNTTVLDNFCTPAKTLVTTTDLDIAAFTPTQLSGFKYRIYYNDNLAGGAWNWGFCFDSPTIISVPTPCLTGTNYPTGVFTPSTCNGFTVNQVASDSSAGDYFDVAVTSGQTYKFASSVATDFYTISTDGGTTSAASGTQPLTWVSTITGTIRVYLTTNITCGTDAADRTTSIVCGTLCLTGTQYPFATLTPTTCDGNFVNVLTDDSYAGEYSNIEVFSANTYTFSSSVATDYITITSADGTTPLAVGTGSVAGFTPAANGIVRFYFHTDAACGIEAVNRERRVVCTTAAVAPGCPINPTPADGSTTVSAFDDIFLDWDASATGDAPVSYDVYFGDSATTLQFAGTVLPEDLPINGGAVGDYDVTIFWQVIAVNAAGESVGCAVWSFTTESQPTDTPDFVNLQWPPNLTVVQGNSGDVYGRIYEPGLTDTTTGQAPGVLAWVGISDEGDNSNPDTWTTWIPATFLGETGNDDEYKAAIGAALTPGTYYYATRFTLNGGPYVYGGINATNPNLGGYFWDGTAFVSGVLTVTPAPPPANDDCSGAVALTAGNAFADQDIVATNLGATDSAVPDPACSSYLGGDVWFSIVVPSATLTIETQSDNDSITDTGLEVFSGTCPGGLTAIACNDDAGVGFFSLLNLTGLTVGSTIYMRVFAYDNLEFGTFRISAYDPSLASNTFDNTSFSYYPNPVKNVLNLSYSQDITNVEVFNLLGQKMSANAIGSNVGQIDMSNLASGAYMVKVTANNQVKTIKVIKE